MNGCVIGLQPYRDLIVPELPSNTQLNPAIDVENAAGYAVSDVLTTPRSRLVPSTKKNLMPASPDFPYWVVLVTFFVIARVV